MSKVLIGCRHADRGEWQLACELVPRRDDSGQYKHIDAERDPVHCSFSLTNDMTAVASIYYELCARVVVNNGTNASIASAEHCFNPMLIGVCAHWCVYVSHRCICAHVCVFIGVYMCTCKGAHSCLYMCLNE